MAIYKAFVIYKGYTIFKQAHNHVKLHFYQPSLFNKFNSTIKLGSFTSSAWAKENAHPSDHETDNISRLMSEEVQFF